MTGPRVHVTVDLVVVSGMPAAEARNAVRAMDAHLATLLADPTTLLPLRDTAVPPFGPTSAARPGSGAHLGRTAAGVIHAAVQAGRGAGG